MVRYIKDIDVAKAVLFLDLIITKNELNAMHGIPESGHADDEIYGVFDPVKLQECVDFFDAIVIPKLAQENQDLLLRYGGEEQFMEDFCTLESQIPNLFFCTFDGDEIHDDPETLSGCFFFPLRALFAKAIETNQPYVIMTGLWR